MHVIVTTPGPRDRSLSTLGACFFFSLARMIAIIRISGATYNYNVIGRFARASL